MSNTMLEKEIPVYSKKLDIHGVIRDYGMVTKLFFSYDGKEIEMGLARNRDLLEDSMEQLREERYFVRKTRIYTGE